MPRFRCRLGFLFLISASRLAAQSVELRLRDETTSVPIGGAIVRLLGGTGAVAQGLTDEAGRLVLRAPGRGSYRLRIDRIGWLGFTTDPFDVDSAQTLRLAVPMPSQRNRLPTLVVWGKSRCDSKQPQSDLAGMLWDEVQKALTANAITESQRLVPLHLREFVREVDLHGRPLREWVVMSRIVRGPPFGSLPPSSLSTTGFAYQMGDTAVFAAPDAVLLLSEQFVSTHCFYASRGAGTLQGLAFRPTSGRPVPDVSGTLWVDRESSELRYLDFSYTGLPDALRRRELGGRIEFTRLPGGRWIISYWHIRMPRVEVQAPGPRRLTREVADLTGFTDRGGRAEIAGDTLGLVHRAIVTGRVYDSIAGAGLTGALVWIQGTPDSMPTDAAGRFEMATESTGDQIVSVRHPRLGLLGESTDRPTLLSLGDTSRVEFSVPPIGAFDRALCRNRNRPGHVSVIGTARSIDGSPSVDREIVAMKRTGRGNEYIAETAPFRTTRTGLYGLCNLPVRDTVQVSMMDGKVTLVAMPVTLIGTSRWVDLREWGSADSASAAFVELLARTGGLTGPDSSVTAAAVAGRVYDLTTGQAMPGAVVRVHGETDSALADDRGRFSLRTHAAGWQILTVAHAATGELRGTVTRNTRLAPGDSLEVDFPVIPVRRVMGRECGERGGRAGLVGIVSGPAGPADSGLLLRVSWGANGGRRLDARTGPGGLFVFCDLPTDLIGGDLLTIQVVGVPGVIAQPLASLGSGEHRWVEMKLPRS